MNEKNHQSQRSVPQLHRDGLNKKVPIDEDSSEQDFDGEPMAAVRTGFKKGGAEQNLHQAVLDYTFVADEATSSTDEDAACFLVGRKEYRKYKQARIEKRKADYLKAKKEKEKAKKAKLDCRQSYGNAER